MSACRVSILRVKALISVVRTRSRPHVRLDLLALLLDAALQRLRALAGGDQRERSPQRERKYRHREQEAESTTHGRAMLGALRRRDQRSALVMERARNPAACRSFPWVDDADTVAP